MLEKDEINKLEGPIVIFGAGGFIGANLFRRILKVRQDVYGVTHQEFIPWRLAGLPENNILRADIKDKFSLEQLFERFGFKAVFNFAAYGSYPKQTEIDEIYATNVIGTVNLMEVSAKKGVKTFVQAGSQSEYGTNCAAPAEKAELVPNSHYAVSKVTDAYLVKYYAKMKNLPAVNLRFYSVYGPYEEPDRLIPTLVGQAMKGALPPLVEPQISRDFVYIDDAVDAAIRAALTGVTKAPGGSFNIASGRKTTIKEIIDLARELFNVEVEPVWNSMPNRGWDLKDWYGDPALAKTLLGWQAITSLKEGLTKTADWLKKNPNASTGVGLMRQKRKLSAVIACYLDGKAIPIMYERLTKVFGRLGVDYEIIFVNDASPDNSGQVLTELTSKDKHVIAIEHSRNFGSQSAFLSGLEVSSGDAAILLDGDLQDPPELIEEFYAKWLNGFEVVYGRRVKRETTKVLNFCYKAFYRLFRGVAYIPMPLDAGDFSLIDRKVVDQLVALPETDQFLRGLRAWVGFRQTGVDYIRPERMFGVTTNNWRKNIWWAKKAVFSFSFVPLELLSYFGLILTAVSFLALIGQIVARLFLPNVPQGLTMIIVLVLFFGAVQVLAISIIGEYLMKIFEETKKRPKFIRRSISWGGKQFVGRDQIAAFSGRSKHEREI